MLFLICVFVFIILAGTPPTTVSGCTSFVTIALGAIITLLPIVIPPKTLAPNPIKTLSPITGTPDAEAPMVTPG